MTLRGHIIKGPCDFMVRNSSLYVTNLSNLVVIVIVLVEITYLICQVTFQDHAIKGSCGSKFIVCNNPVRFGGYRYCDRRDIFLIYHFTLPGHGSNVLCDFMGESGLQKLWTYRAVKTSTRCKKKRAPKINSNICFITIL